MTYPPLLIVHITGGVVGVAAGTTALLVRKGGRVHRMTGDAFVVAMLVMGAAGAAVALVKSQPTNVIAGLFTMYLVTSAWLTMKRSANQIGRSEWALMLYCIAVGVGGLIASGVISAASATKHAPPGLVVFAVIGFMFAIGDYRMLARGGVAGPSRLVRHLGRMCLALLVASGSFFLGMADDPVMRKNGLRATLFTPEIRKTGLPAVPVLLVLVLMIYWLIRVQTSRKYRTNGPRVTLPDATVALDAIPAITDTRS